MKTLNFYHLSGFIKETVCSPTLFEVEFSCGFYNYDQIGLSAFGDFRGKLFFDLI